MRAWFTNSSHVQILAKCEAPPSQQRMSCPLSNVCCNEIADIPTQESANMTHVVVTIMVEADHLDS